MKVERIFQIIEWRKPVSVLTMTLLLACYERTLDRAKFGDGGLTAPSVADTDVDLTLRDLRDMGYIDSNMETTPRGDRKVWAMMEMLA